MNTIFFSKLFSHISWKNKIKNVKIMIFQHEDKKKIDWISKNDEDPKLKSEDMFLTIWKWKDLNVYAKWIFGMISY